jgi:hypothetical protein
MPYIINLFLAFWIVALSGCGRKAQTLSVLDPQLAPIVQAIAASDRVALGFGSIPTNAVVHLGGRSGARHDVEIIVYDSPALYGGIYRNIELRKTATGYQWIREFESHPGPMTFTQSGHTAHELILIGYDTDGMSGLAPSKLDVRYTGPDSRLAIRKSLTLDQVRPILAEWSQKQ